MNIRARAPRGYSLMEMLAVTMVFTVVLSLTCAVLAMLMRLNDAARRHTDVLMTSARLARLFRADVNAATRFELDPDLTLHHGAHVVVRYECDPKWIKRTLLQDGTQVATERFRMHKPGARCVQSSEDGSTIVTLEFDQNSAGKDARVHPLRIDAVLGSDHRFLEADSP